MSRRERSRRGRGTRTSGTVEERSPTVEVDAGRQPTLWTGLWGGLGLASSLAGFVLLGQGSIQLAPALLVLAFGAFFPLALVK